MVRPFQIDRLSAKLNNLTKRTESTGNMTEIEQSRDDFHEEVENIIALPKPVNDEAQCMVGWKRNPMSRRRLSRQNAL